MIGYIGGSSGFPILRDLEENRPLGPIGTTFATDNGSQVITNVGGFRIISFFITVVGNSPAPQNEVAVELNWFTSNAAVEAYQQLRRDQANPDDLVLDVVNLPPVANGTTSYFTISAANPGGALACRARFRDISGAVVFPDVRCLCRGST